MPMSAQRPGLPSMPVGPPQALSGPSQRTVECTSASSLTLPRSRFPARVPAHAHPRTAACMRECTTHARLVLVSSLCGPVSLVPAITHDPPTRELLQSLFASTSLAIRPCPNSHHLQPCAALLARLLRQAPSRHHHPRLCPRAHLKGRPGRLHLLPSQRNRPCPYHAKAARLHPMSGRLLPFRSSSIRELRPAPHPRRQ